MIFNDVNLGDLPKIAKYLIENNDRRVFLFKGEMGAGKTTLIKSICKVLKCQDEVSSPTFALINHYLSERYGDVFHFDFYRIKTSEEAMDIGFEEYIDSGAYCFIEWPEMVLKLISVNYVEVQIVSNRLTRQINVHLS
ncbi:MAG: tRNA (adenosine(37)-N6)-threonylcarbamoyltransferase complex ATPase subunit type 1 TsaE [Vicingaceae bacterium]